MNESQAHAAGGILLALAGLLLVIALFGLFSNTPQGAFLGASALIPTAILGGLGMLFTFS